MGSTEQLKYRLGDGQETKHAIRTGDISQLEMESFITTKDDLLRRLELGPPQALSSLPTGQYIENLYRPCTTALADLCEIKIADLQLEFHHSGKVLFAKRIGDAGSSLSCALLGIEDIQGDISFLSLQCFSTCDDEFLSRGAIVAIKEPYFALNPLERFKEVLVAHPADLLVLVEDDTRIPAAFRSQLGLSNNTAQQFKAEGNHKMRAGRYLTATKHYSSGLCLVQQSDIQLKSDLLRNRAQAYLALKCFEAAKADALASVINDKDDASVRELNAKAFYRAGCASYGLAQFDDAEAFFAKTLQLSPDNKVSAEQMRKTRQRQNERDYGQYKFEDIIKIMESSKEDFVDAASFTRKVEIRETPAKGRGLFAKEDIKFGDIILCEKAAHTAREGDPGVFSTVKYHIPKNTFREEKVSCGYRGLVQKLTANSCLIPKVASLCAGPTCPTTPSPTTTIIDGQPIIDAYQIGEIYATNTFALPAFQDFTTKPWPLAATDTSSHGSGLWYLIAHINHACISNAQIAFLGDLAILRARRDISAGEEISLIYYCPENLEERQQALQQTWGFTCCCPLCTSEATIPSEIREKREGILNQLYNLALDSSSSPTEMHATIDSLQTTYPNDNLPRAAVAQAYSIFAQTLYKRGAAVEMLSRILFLALRADGIVPKPDPKDGVWHLEARPWTMNKATVENLVHLMECAKATNSPILADEIEKVARKLYVILNDLEVGFELVGQ